MQLRKILAAGALAALMAGSSIALAADLSNYPQPFVSADGAANFLVVVGSGADPADVIGAIDVATRLGGESTTTATSAGTTTTVSLSGRSEEIPLDELVVGSGKFPSILKHNHVPALAESKTVDWDYQTDDKIDTSEQFVLGNLNVTRNPVIYNGTISLTVPDPNTAVNTPSNIPFYYRYKFDETMEGQGNLSTVHPLKITVLGTEFDITEIGTTYVVAMAGEQLDINAGETKTTKDGFDIRPWQYYPTDSAWDVTISKNNQSVTHKLTVGTSTNTPFVIGSETVNARVISNQTVTTYAVGGGTTTSNLISVIAGTTTELRYQDDQSKQDTPTKLQGDNRFPGTDGKWRFDFTIATAGKFTRGDTIDVYYDPWNPDVDAESSNNGQSLNLTVGQKISLPNNYFDVEFAAMNTETVATVTVLGAEMTVYYGGPGNTTAYWTNVPSVKITTDKGRLLNATTCSLGDSIEKDEVYIIYRNTTAAGNAIYLGTKDSDGYLRNRSEAMSLDSSNTNVFLVDYGDYTNSMTIQAMNRTNTYDIKATDYLSDTVQMDFTIGETNSTGYRIYLGDYKSDEPNAADVKVGGVNAASYKDYYTLYGVDVNSIYTNAKSDRVVMKVPTTQLKGVVAVGKDIAVGGVGGTTYKAANPIKTAVGKLDTEIGDTQKSENNIVLVGGPCANTLVRTLLNSTAATCLSDFEALGYTSGSAMIKYVANAWGTGKAALIVAGRDAADTRKACAVLEDYGAYATTLKGTQVKVVGSTVTQVA
jgi:hypothetical protein